MVTGLCVDTQRCLLGVRGPHQQLYTADRGNVCHHCGCGPFCSHRQLRRGETQFMKLFKFSTRESSKDKWHENQNSPCFNFLGRQVRVSPALANEVNQTSQSLLPFWCEKQVAFLMVKDLGFEARLSEFVTPFYYLWVV